MSVLVHYTAVCINLYNDLCTILNGCIIVQLFSAAGDLVTVQVSLCSLFCVGLKTLLFHLLSLRSLFVWTMVMIHRDIEAICNILYGLSEESLLLCFPEIFFFLHCSRVTLYTDHCTPSVCVSVLCKVRYTREVKTTVMQVVN